MESGYDHELSDEIIVHCGDMVKGTAMLLGHTEQEKNEDPIQFYPQMFFCGMFKACGNKGDRVCDGWRTCGIDWLQ